MIPTLAACIFRN